MRGVLRTSDQRGALSIEFLLIISALMIVFLVMLQYAVKAHAHRVAEAAAEEALAAAAAYDGSVTSGETAAKNYLNDIGSDLDNPQVTVTRNQSTAAVTVKGDVQPFIPFLSVHVSVHLEGPIEKFVESP
jgi:Flp pilus assembly protein TadG